MEPRKIIHFETEKYEITGAYSPKKCQECKLSVSERLDTCFKGCFDEIVKSEEYIKSKVDIFNTVECQKIMNNTVLRLNNILGFENTLIYGEREFGLYEKIKKSVIGKLLTFKKIILGNL